MFFIWFVCDCSGNCWSWGTLINLYAQTIFSLFAPENHDVYKRVVTCDLFVPKNQCVQKYLILRHGELLAPETHDMYVRVRLGEL